MIERFISKEDREYLKEIGVGSFAVVSIFGAIALMIVLFPIKAMIEFLKGLFGWEGV